MDVGLRDKVTLELSREQIKVLFEAVEHTYNDALEALNLARKTIHANRWIPAKAYENSKKVMQIAEESEELLLILKDYSLDTAEQKEVIENMKHNRKGLEAFKRILGSAIEITIPVTDDLN